MQYVTELFGELVQQVFVVSCGRNDFSDLGSNPPPGDLSLKTLRLSGLHKGTGL